VDRIRTREKIVAKATEEILRQGYSRTTMDAIATRLGMSKKTIYQLYPSKKDLLRGVLSALQMEIEQGLEQIVFRPDLAFREKWLAVVEFTACQYGRFGPGFVDDLRTVDPEIFQILDKFRSDLVQRCFSSLAAEGVREGAFRADIDPRFLSAVYLAIVQAILNPVALQQLGMAPDHAYLEVVKLILDGITRHTHQSDTNL
jgi:AcrR family transcriptional regulator